MQASAVIQAILAAVSAAPKVAALVQSAKEFITQMFNAGLISREVQNSTHAYVDAIVAMADASIVPPHWQVEPDAE